jgi:DNA polymerase/3'-5' exonuclease PolX
MSIQNPDVAEIFKQVADLLEIEGESRFKIKKVADLLEIEGESRFKIKAYRDAARTVGGHSRMATSARG